MLVVGVKHQESNKEHLKDKHFKIDHLNFESRAIYNPNGN